MPQTHADEHGRIPMSQGLAASLGRAHEHARAQGHRLVTLEHLLFALTDDDEAMIVLAASSVDIDRLRTDISDFLNQSAQPAEAGEAGAPQISPELTRIVEYAAAAAKQGRRAQVTGAIALAAMIGEGHSTAAGLLRTQGLTFEAAVRALQEQMRSQGPPPAQARQNGAPAPSAEQIIATARERIAASRNQSAGAAAGPRRSGADDGRENAGSGDAPPPQPPPEAAAAETLEGGEKRTREGASQPPAPATENDAPNVDVHPSHATDAPARGPSHAPDGTAGEPAERAPLDIRTHPPSGEAPDQRAEAAVPRRTSWTPPPLPAMSAERDARLRQPQRPEREPGGEAAAEAPEAHDRVPLPHWMAQRTAGAHGEPAVSLPRPLPGGARLPQGMPPLPSGGGIASPSLRSPGGNGAEDRAAALGTRPGQPSAAPAVQPGQLVENIPRRMRVGIAATAEVRIGHADAEMSAGWQGTGVPTRHRLFITKAMSVRLRAPDGGFRIEAASPETQWTEATIGQLSSDFAVWRFSVTPERRGKAVLQLVVAARVVGRDGVMAETTLPDRVIGVRVRANYVRTATRWSGWLAALAIGGIIGKLGENALASAIRLLSRAAAG